MPGSVLDAEGKAVKTSKYLIPAGGASVRGGVQERAVGGGRP